MPHPKSSVEPASSADEASVIINAMAFDLPRYLRERAVLIEHHLAISVPESDGPTGRLIEAMRYSLMAGGKRLRPILALAACEAVGGPTEAALGYACALEMIHTYSLVHDDLPCMDDDDLRRGRPTNHKVFGEAIAVLAGDGLLTDAFGLLVGSTQSAGIPAQVIIDTLAEGQPLTQQELEHLHSKKTGALFVASVCGGARLGGAGSAQLQLLRDYAAALGLAFQITDDLLDVEQATEHLGKRSHKDLQRGKATYPSVIGIERSRALAHELAQHACQALAGFDSRAEALRMLAGFAVERNL